jgi:hypothetical protein
VQLIILNYCLLMISTFLSLYLCVCVFFYFFIFFIFKFIKQLVMSGSKGLTSLTKHVKLELTLNRLTGRFEFDTPTRFTNPTCNTLEYSSIYKYLEVLLLCLGSIN